MKIVEVILDTLQLEFQAYKCKSCDSEFEKNLETFWTPLSLQLLRSPSLTAWLLPIPIPRPLHYKRGFIGLFQRAMRIYRKAQTTVYAVVWTNVGIRTLLKNLRSKITNFYV